MAKCNQSGCEKPGAFRFTWPGNDEAEICDDHVGKLRSVANAMGLYVQIRPVEPAPVPAAKRATDTERKRRQPPHLQR